METFTFDQLPQAVSKLHDKLNSIEQLLLQANNSPTQEDELLTVSQAAKFLNLSVPTIYGKVSRKEIPVNKQGKRLYFHRSELGNWIKAGRQKTVLEITQEAEENIVVKKRK